MYRKQYHPPRKAANPQPATVLVVPPPAPTAEESAWNDVYERANHPHQARALVELFHSQPGLAAGREALFIKASLCVHDEAWHAERKRVRRIGLRRLIDWLLPVDAAPSTPAGLPAPPEASSAPPLYADVGGLVSPQHREVNVDLEAVDPGFETAAPTPGKRAPEKCRAEVLQPKVAPAPRANIVAYDNATAKSDDIETIPGA